MARTKNTSAAYAVEVGDGPRRPRHAGGENEPEEAPVAGRGEPYNGGMARAKNTSAAYAVEVGDGPITREQLDAAYGRPVRVRLTSAAVERIERSRATLERLAASPAAIYGVNTGFGTLCRQRIPPDQLAKLQENLVRSHAVGVGPAAPAEIVRWMLWFKIQSLAAGYSGVQRGVVEALAGWLSADALPVVPARGSLGASGDLAPLAHLSLPLIGEGRMQVGGETIASREALGRLGLARVALGPKDGLALLNGTQFMSAYGAALGVRAARLAKHADIIATMTLEAIRGSVRPFDERLIGLRAHPGAVATAGNVRTMMADSEILASHANCDKVQDPYSVRCVPQVHGACRDAARHAADAVMREVNSVTDNPVLLGDEAVSGGNFHGEPLALALDYLAMGLTVWANISERRTYLLLTGPDGLPPLLMPDTGINSGLMLPQYTAAALVNECKVLSHPASTDSIPTSLGQEDHVSMGGQSALKCWQVMENAEMVLAIELLCAAQALDFRVPLKPGIGPRTAHAVVREHIPHADADREYGQDIEAALQLLRSGDIVRRVENAIGSLS